MPSITHDTATWWTPKRKAIASVLVLFHLFAVFASPCASPPPTSYAWNWIAGRVDGRDGLLMPYLRAGYLNHGYRFFAPNPGPSHLVRYEIQLKSGGEIKGHFPDTEEQFPRLLYHRMFMISETAFNLAEPVRQSAPPGTLSELEKLEFDKQLAASDALAKSIARRLLAEYDGQRVRLFLRTHEIPFPADILAGQKLNDPILFHEQPWREYNEEQL
jgi:hypothetical protein